MMSTPGIFVFITSIFKYYYFTSTRLACILVMRVESDSFWYTVKIVSLYQIRTYMHGKLHETTQCLKIDYLIIDCRLLIVLKAVSCE